MSTTLITGISELVTMDPAHGPAPSAATRPHLGVIERAAIVVDNDAVLWSGPQSTAPDADEHVDLGGRAVIPGFVDSHTHIVFAGDRSREFEARMAGDPYDGGGIATTMAATRDADEPTLAANARSLLTEMHEQGTTTVEIKSGYGLSVADEVRMLRAAATLTPETTFLGAHVVPPEYRDDRAAYVDLVSGPMLDACAPYVRWADVFCEPGAPTAFDADESRAVLTAAGKAGLGLRVHAGQLGPGPGVALGVELGAASVDHCTHLTDADITMLAEAAPDGPVATLLPGVEFSTRSPYPQARRLLDAGVLVALATDCNPGSSFTSSMPFCIALAVRDMGMTAAEALWAATEGGARALRRTDVGNLRPGSRPHLCVLDAPSYRHLPYRPGVPIASTLEL
ncbi:imidazolonepropionase [Actinobacteria bacterium YIM 96077]|uniref:Imidazolonepropionase n=1 Tax=Phytoactinopolyspora halophila TaxID=1981511 RepID=A0A329R3A4_9ACTN|nr:imidazolonepropionase [Phytoactinopolyspora halophila]AYY11893.1 imidazolonepropionase [Actinobacteria bacterium YIM 96077]RAW18873.1 imidazolonepropionase [Phytoactinopolyspora halophila]